MILRPHDLPRRESHMAHKLVQIFCFPITIFITVMRSTMVGSSRIHNTNDRLSRHAESNSGHDFLWTISFSKHSKLVRHKVCVEAKNRTMAVRGMWKSAHTPQCLISRSEIHTNFRKRLLYD